MTRIDQQQPRCANCGHFRSWHTGRSVTACTKRTYDLRRKAPGVIIGVRGYCKCPYFKKET